MVNGYWARVHENLFDHPKFVDLDNDAVVMWLSAVLYCKRAKVDGIIPIDHLRSLSNVKRWKTCLEILVKREIFDMDLDGKNIRIHNFLQWQTSSADIEKAEAEKAENRKRTAEWRAKRKKEEQEEAEAKQACDAKCDASQEALRDREQRTETETETETEINTLATDSVDCGKESFTEAVMTVCKLAQTDLTESARGAIASAVKQLRDAGASPGEIEARAEIYRRLYPDATLTPSALVKHWPALTKESIPPTVWERALAELEAGTA